MLRIPYTFDQAKSLCDKLQSFVGYCFDLHSPEVCNIECIAVSPFDCANKKIFLLNYLLTEDAEKSLKEDYKGLLYDVIIITRSVHNNLELVHEDVVTWMRKHNLTLADIPSVSKIEANFLNDNSAH